MLGGCEARGTTTARRGCAPRYGSRTASSVPEADEPNAFPSPAKGLARYGCGQGALALVERMQSCRDADGDAWKSSEAQVSERPRARKLVAHCASQRRDRETAPARSKQHSRVSRLPPGTDAWRRKRLVRGQVEAIATCPRRARLRAAAGRSHWEVKASAWRLACRANEGTRRRRLDACGTATVSTTCRAQNRRRRSGRPRR
jgi:rhodanese-related sulfurtransferase